MRLAPLRLAFAGCLALPACATITTTSDVRETPISERTQTGIEAPAVPKLAAAIRGNLLGLTLSTEETCFEARYQTIAGVQYTTRTITGNEGWYDVYWVGGVVGTVGGAVALGISPVLSDQTGTDAETGKEQASDRTMALVLGGIALAFGIPMLTVAIVDTARAADDIDELPPREQQIDRRTFPCHGVPMAGVTVAGRLGTTRAELGATDEQGVLEVDLGSLLSLETLAAAGPAPALDIIVDPFVIGSVPLAPFVAYLETEAWTAAETAGTVDAWQGFLAAFPNSLRAEAARRQAAQLESEARAAAEESDWAAADAAATPEAFLEFIDAHPDSGRASTARVQVIDLLLAADRVEEAEAHFSEWARSDAAIRSGSASIMAAIAAARQAREQQAAAEQAQAATRVRQTLGRARDAASGCSAGGCSSANATIAASAYRLVDSVRHQATSRQVSDGEMGVLARCGCTRSAVGVP